MSDTQLVGIVNVTPDSFSDGGAHFDAPAAIQAIERLIADGADVIDIGAESTRPGATPISPEEEWQRLAPVLAALRQFSDMRFSLDTRHADTARRALEAGVHWINDVTGFSHAVMVDAVRSSDCRLVIMHSLCIPADKAIVMPESADIVTELLAFAHKRIDTLYGYGIKKGRIVFDPGIGFGKTAAQSLDILRRIGEFSVLGVPLVIGHSRKSFLSSFGDRDAATLAVSQSLAQRGVDFLRVHDVARHRQMLNLVKALTYG